MSVYLKNCYTSLSMTMVLAFLGAIATVAGFKWISLFILAVAVLTFVVGILFGLASLVSGIRHILHTLKNH